MSGASAGRRSDAPRTIGPASGWSGPSEPHDAAGPTPFWGGSLASCCAALDTNGDGLDTSEAARRLERFGLNRIGHAPATVFVRQFILRLGNPLVLLLLFAAIVAAVTGDRASFLLVTLVVISSVTLDAYQEHRAGRAAERLQASVAVRARVVRDGTVVEVPREQVVPGDVVELSAGSLVPADGRVLEADDCFVNQASITGEAFPVEKHAVDLPGTTIATEAQHALFMGSSLVSGSARMLVCRTGAATLLGGIGESLRHAPPATAFERGLRDFGLLILRVASGMVLFVLLVNALHHRPWLESFLFAVALAVGLTPELLPMIVTVTLSRGALRMAARRVIVKRLGAVHDLGAMDVLCTDKTGTLTEAAVRIAHSLDPQGRASPRPLRLAWLNSRLETGLRSPLDEAILAQPDLVLDGWRKIDEVPFDFERRRLSVLADDGTQRLLIVKGAFEEILRLSSECESDTADAPVPLDEATRERCREGVAALGREGYRVLGVAWKRTSREHTHAVVDDEAALVLAGVLAFEDPPKVSASRALADLAAAGVAVKIITGDDERVTRHVCETIGVHVTGLLTGHEIEGLAEPAFALRCEEANLFCRVSPQQKSRIIRALRRRGHVVGYLGDGINDAPALHDADVGLSVDGAVDVAREAADLILLEHDLAVVHGGVQEGRRTFGNILKYLLMGTSSNFGNMLSMALGTLILPFLPLLPVQVLLNNLMYDLSEVPIPLDHVEPSLLERPHRFDIRHLRDFMLVVGPVSSVFDLATFAILRYGFHAAEPLFHTGWFVESMATQVLVVLVIRTPGDPFRARPHPALLVTALAVVGLAFLLPWTGFGRQLGFVPLPGSYVALLVGMVIAYLMLVEVVKRRFYRRVTSAA